MPKTNSVLSNLKFSIKKLLFLVQGSDRIHISSIFDSKNAFANFHTHDFMGSKHMLKCFSLGCKHYHALFRTKWSSQTQKVKIFIKWLQVIVSCQSQSVKNVKFFISQFFFEPGVQCSIPFVNVQSKAFFRSSWFKWWLFSSSKSVHCASLFRLNKTSS